MHRERRLGRLPGCRTRQRRRGERDPSRSPNLRAPARWDEGDREERPEVSSEQPTGETGPPSTNVASDIPEKKTAQMKARDVYLARALRDCSTPGHLSFSKGDIITLRPTESKSTWVGKKRKGSGFVDSKDVEISSRPIPHLMGIPFYQLAVALLEIAHQSTLAARDLEPIESISSETDFAAHLKALDKFVDQAGSIMGSSYEVIVRECLRNVVYASENLMMDVYLQMQHLTFDSDLHLRNLPEAAWTMFMKQDQAMEEIYAPLQAMVKSGFRASRQIFVPRRIACSNSCESVANSPLVRRRARMGNWVIETQVRLRPQRWITRLVGLR